MRCFICAAGFRLFTTSLQAGENRKMKPKWIARGLAFLIFVLILIAGFGQAVLQLWNWLMPDIFGLRPISFWQAVGLMGLSWILFGRLGRFRFTVTGLKYTSSWPGGSVMQPCDCEPK